MNLNQAIAFCISGALLCIGSGVNFKVDFEMPRAIAQRSPVTSNQQQPVTTNNTPTSSRRRHKITVTVSDPSDIKIEEGQRIQAGDIIADRTRERQKLEQQRRELNNAIARLSQPLPTPPPPPAPNYAREMAAIDSAQAAIAYWENVPQPQYRFKKRDYILAMDSDIIKERQQLVEKRMQAQNDLSDAIALLQAAKSNYQREQYSYQLQLQQYEQDEREQQLKLLEVQQQVPEIEKKIEENAAVRSPYAGRVRRVKIEGQNNLNLTAEITLLIRANETTSNL